MGCSITSEIVGATRIICAANLYQCVSPNLAAPNRAAFFLTSVEISVTEITSTQMTDGSVVITFPESRHFAVTPRGIMPLPYNDPFKEWLDASMFASFPAAPKTIAPALPAIGGAAAVFLGAAVVAAKNPSVTRRFWSL